MADSNLITMLSKGKTYSRNELLCIFRESVSDMSDTRFRWLLYNMQRKHEIYRSGYDSYTIDEVKHFPKYRPLYTDSAKRIMRFFQKNFDGISYVVYESTQLNEFLNHQIAQNTLYVQVEKDVSSYAFDVLRGKCKNNVLYKPNAKDFARYWARDCIVILELVSQAPLSEQFPHEMTGEKLLVDILADKSIAATFSPAELPSIYENFKECYDVDRRKLNRYAGRRGKTKEINRYMGEG